MKGDFTRDTFDKDKQFSRVLMQQGRVQLDADWNEQTSILLHYLRTLAAHIIGPHGGPADDCGFEIAADGNGDLTISQGYYYVDGILCENREEAASVETQGVEEYLVYLDVWERLVTCIEDDEIREKALDGPDTAARARVAWQVKVQDLIGDIPDALQALIDDNTPLTCDIVNQHWETIVGLCWQPENRGKLKASAPSPATDDSDDPCAIPPDAGYRGLENQLYRVEIHDGGPAGEATFKWSRENGSVAFPILSIAGSDLLVDGLGTGDRFSLREGDWVEVVDDDYHLHDSPEPLRKVIGLDHDEGKVTLDTAPAGAGSDQDKHPFLRRWDQNSDALTIGGPNSETVWELELGIQIEFCDPESSTFRSGDYWLIPARTIPGDVEWPQSPDGGAAEKGPHGVEHHYAPLYLQIANSVPEECSRHFTSLPILTDYHP